jgi:small nuclear ribonucleoprotein (snRNP)-like protein
VKSIVVELSQQVQHKLLEDRKLEASLREFDRHLELQAREVAMRYCEEQDAFVQRFAATHATVYTAVQHSRAAANSFSGHWTPRCSHRGGSSPYAE